MTSDRAGSSQIRLIRASSGIILDTASLTSFSLESKSGCGLITTLLLTALAILTVRLCPPAPPNDAGSLVITEIDPASRSTS